MRFATNFGLVYKDIFFARNEPNIVARNGPNIVAKSRTDATPLAGKMDHINTRTLHKTRDGVHPGELSQALPLLEPRLLVGFGADLLHEAARLQLLRLRLLRLQLLRLRLEPLGVWRTIRVV